MGHDIEYPVTPTTINKYAEMIEKSVKLGLSTSIIFPDKSGGARAWLKFLLDENSPTDFLANISKEGHVVTTEPYESLENSKIGFFYNLLESLDRSETHQSIEAYSLNFLLGDIHTQISKLLKTNKKIIIFYIGLGKFDQFDASYGNLLYAIWKKYLGRIIFVASFKESIFNDFSKNKAGSFDSALTEKVIKIETLGNEDLIHIIEHWEGRLGVKFSEGDKEIILKYSQNSAPVIKSLCQLLSVEKAVNTLDAEGIVKKFVEENYPIKIESRAIRSKANKYYIGDISLNKELTNAEMDIFSVLFAYKGSVVDKKQIAKALWGANEYEKYSDWAIDKHISSIRKTLHKLGALETIKSVKGKGYLLEKV